MSQAYAADIALTRATTATSISSSTENTNQTTIENAVNSLDGDNVNTAANLSFTNLTCTGVIDFNSAQTTVNAIDLDSANTTGNAVDISCTALTTGAALALTNTANMTYRQGMVEISQDHTTTGGVCISIDQNSDTDVIRDVDNTARLTSGGVWTDSSDANLKENFSDMDVLSKVKTLTIKLWNYKEEGKKSDEDIDLMDMASEEKVKLKKKQKDKKVPKHFGPTGQEFYDSFGLGDATGISGRDLAAIALKACQELLVRVEKLEAEVAALKNP